MESKAGKMSTSLSLKRKPDMVSSRAVRIMRPRGVVMSRESSRNGRIGKRVTNQNWKGENGSNLHEGLWATRQGCEVSVRCSDLVVSRFVNLGKFKKPKNRICNFFSCACP